MLASLARFILRVGGWKVFGAVPDEPRAVLIAAPHTSNWDGFWALVYKVAVGLDVKFFAKHSLFWFPLGNLLRGTQSGPRGLGGRPGYRDVQFQRVILFRPCS